MAPSSPVSPVTASLQAMPAHPGRALPRIAHNRVHAVLLHVPWYGFRPQARLSRDSGVSPSAVSRLIRGKAQPSLTVALAITRALSLRLGKPLDVLDVFSLDGSYPTPSVCHLTGCRSCLPPEAYDGSDSLRPEYQGARAGDWSLSPLALSPLALSPLALSPVVPDITGDTVEKGGM